MTEHNTFSPQEYKVTSNITFASQPQPVGAWVLYPGAQLRTKFMMYVRPTDEQIKATEQLLGWGWEEA